jgi:NAD(P)-dependent dehydrogenase (short-subunit alcohol dehydrogenase family)
MPELRNRVALVTGGSRGIGKSIALALAKAGATVAVNYHKGSHVDSPLNSRCSASASGADFRSWVRASSGSASPIA